MADNTSLPTTKMAIQDEIALYETLVNSMEYEGESNCQDYVNYKQRLIALNEQLSWLEASPPNHPSQSASSTNSHRWHAPLVVPKRGVDVIQEEEDGEESSSRPSRRVKTSETGTPRSNSLAGADFDFDHDLQEVFESDWRESNRKYLRSLEEKKAQEEEDARFARELAAQWGVVPEIPQSSKPKPPFGAINAFQSTFAPNGSFTFSQPMVKPESRQLQPSFRASSPITVASSDADDDDFGFLDRDEWNSQYPQGTNFGRVLPGSFAQQSGKNVSKFPINPYTSLAGSSVYANEPSQSGIVQRGLQGLRNLSSGISSLGSMMNPFDLDTSFLSRYDSSHFAQDITDGPTPPWERFAVDPRETQEEIRQLLQSIRPDEEIDISKASDTQPAGLKVELMPHQVKGLIWMREKEDSTNKGGILADDMGLGKTIQAISLILSRPPSPEQKLPVLIITPVALMDQWKREIQKVIRPSHKLTIQILHGSTAHLPWERTKHFDVLLTTYGALGADLKRSVLWEEKLKVNPNAVRTKNDECAILDEKARFHRVILDEAQCIKNRNTKTAQAACKINADFRWCLSGTPMQNSVEEMYSLVRFCRIRPYNNAEKFAKDISRPLKAVHPHGREKAMQRLQTLLKSILLRRTKKSTIDGQPILDLPEKHIVEERAIFDKDQLDFYMSLERRTQIQFNRYVKAGTIGRNYSKALVLLLRLRQCCCSPQLITNASDFVTDAGINGLDLVSNARSLPDIVVDRIRTQEVAECPVCMDASENPVIFNPCGHALCHECFSRMIESVQQDNAQHIKCPHCRAEIDSKKITDWKSFKSVFVDKDADIKKDMDEDEETASESNDDSDEEDDDSDDGEDLKDFVVPDDSEGLFMTDSSADERKIDTKEIKLSNKSKRTELLDSVPPQPKDIRESSKKKRKAKGKGKSKESHKSLAELRKAGLVSKSAKKKYLKQLSKIYQPCAKIDHLLALLEEIHARGENEKTIVFSSFTSFLDLIEVPLRHHENLANYARYDGSMTAKDRNAAVLQFTDDPTCRIILVSLKAGNAGLNLTVANHVVILDPFWNPFVEHQAADRCHRIGQRREVTVHRVLIGEDGVDYKEEEKARAEAVKDADGAAQPRVFTVEDRILLLQEKKRALVESALDENAASGIARLGQRELGYLFGVNSL